MGQAQGFLWMTGRRREVAVFHRGKQAATLRGDVTVAFREDMADMHAAARQDEMARLTGNYKRGNARLAKEHPRNG